MRGRLGCFGSQRKIDGYPDEASGENRGDNPVRRRRALVCWSGRFVCVGVQLAGEIYVLVVDVVRVGLYGVGADVELYVGGAVGVR